MKAEDQQILDMQVGDWIKEMRRLADRIATAKGTPCAVVLIQAVGEGYEEVAPELIAEDAFCVQAKGWPVGFQIDILNESA